MTDLKKIRAVIAATPWLSNLGTVIHVAIWAGVL
jgi:hypothetical protein